MSLAKIIDDILNGYWEAYQMSKIVITYDNTSVDERIDNLFENQLDLHNKFVDHVNTYTNKLKNLKLSGKENRRRNNQISDLYKLIESKPVHPICR
jgi:uncharacterized protein Yka (UPF0111/DUF47 family)